MGEIMMYGRHYSSMYEGSMVGAGSHVFAVMGYVISKQVPDREVGSQVDLNPELLAFVIGESPERIKQAIEFLCAPDPKSRTKKEDGRRLIRIGEYSYQVVNGAKYLAIRNDEDRRRQNREAKRRQRSKNHQFSGTAAEREYVKAEAAGDTARAEALAAPANPVMNHPNA